MPATPFRRPRAATTARRALPLAALSLGVLLSAPHADPLGAQTPTHAYRLSGSLADERGGPRLVGLGGTVGPSGYTFGAGQGLSLTGALDANVYSLEMAFRLDDVAGFRKVVDFRGRTQDFGFYVQDGFANFFPSGTGGAAAAQFAAGTSAHLVLTRDAGGVFTAFVDGVQAFSLVDNVGLATFAGPGAVAFLLQDDGGFSEYPSGFLDYVRVYDRALTGAEVAVRFAEGDGPLPGPTPPVSPVPEPGTWGLLGTGLVAIAGAARRRRVAA